MAGMVEIRLLNPQPASLVGGGYDEVKEFLSEVRKFKSVELLYTDAVNIENIKKCRNVLIDVYGNPEQTGNKAIISAARFELVNTKESDVDLLGLYEL